MPVPVYVTRSPQSNALYADHVLFVRNPQQAPVHFLVIPKNRDGLTQLSKAEERHEALLGHMMFVAQKMAKKSVGPRLFLSFPFSRKDSSVRTLV